MTNIYTVHIMQNTPYYPTWDLYQQNHIKRLLFANESIRLLTYNSTGPCNVQHCTTGVASRVTQPARPTLGYLEHCRNHLTAPWCMLWCIACILMIVRGGGGARGVWWTPPIFGCPVFVQSLDPPNVNSRGQPSEIGEHFPLLTKIQNGRPQWYKTPYLLM